MLKKILIALVVLVAIFAVVVAMQPADFRYERKMTMNAAPETIFPLVNNFHQWEGWSPWAKIDPDAKTSYEGPDEGVGAIFKWDGNKNVGTGRMTVVESEPNERINIKLDFFKPFEGTHTAEFTFAPAGTQTEVSWSMYGRNDFIGKAMGLIIDCEKMMGDMFNQGLAAIKAIAEAKPSAPAEGAAE